MDPPPPPGASYKKKKKEKNKCIVKCSHSALTKVTENAAHLMCLPLPAPCHFPKKVAVNH